jgi:hypothetical protein
MFIEKQISYSRCKQKMESFRGQAGREKNDITRGSGKHANSTGVPPNQKVNKAEDPM